MSDRVPWPGVAALALLLMVLAAHALAAVLSVPVDAVWYAIGESLGFLVGLVALVALIAQLVRR